MIIGILGATGVGKSAVAVELAKTFDGEIISCDSAQVYKGLDIGTAKITTAEMQGIPHHMLDVVSPDESFSAFHYQQMVAEEVLPKLNKTPIVVGGTGLYFDSLIYGLDFVNDYKLRDELNYILEKEGLDKLLKMLKELDREAYEIVDRNNSVRVIRAIEIAKSGGSVSQKKVRTARPHKLFILNRERQAMYNNINKRVDEMVENNLFVEVEELFERYKDRNLQSLQAIGYKEPISYLLGEISKDEAIEQIKLNTRHYAKRQITYFKRMDGTVVNVDGKGAVEVAEIIANMVKDI